VYVFETSHITLHVKNFRLTDFFILKTFANHLTAMERDRTDITGFMEDHYRDTPYVTSDNVISFHNPIVFLSPLARVLKRLAQWYLFIDATIQSIHTP
jgi:hypothetical protein